MVGAAADALALGVEEVQELGGCLPGQALVLGRGDDVGLGSGWTEPPLPMASGEDGVDEVKRQRLAGERAGSSGAATLLDAAGPERMPFRDLVALVRRAVNAHSPILHIPPLPMAVAARGLGLLVRDVVLTRDEIRGLMTGLLVSHDPPLGRIAFSQWLDEHKTSIGRSYANELHRHFATKRQRP